MFSQLNRDLVEYKKMIEVAETNEAIAILYTVIKKTRAAIRKGDKS